MKVILDQSDIETILVQSLGIRGLPIVGDFRFWKTSDGSIACEIEVDNEFVNATISEDDTTEG